MRYDDVDCSMNDLDHSFSISCRVIGRHRLGYRLGYRLGCRLGYILCCLLSIACATQWQMAEMETDLATPSVQAKQWIQQQQQAQKDHLLPDVLCAQCHTRQAQEFAGSTMRYAMISPVFNALELALNQVGDGVFAHGGSQAIFCSECHGASVLQANQSHSSLRPISDIRITSQ